MKDNGEARSIIHLQTAIGSSQFEITTENCDAVQLFGAAEVLRHLGMEAFAEARGAAIAAHQRKLVVADRMPVS